MVNQGERTDNVSGRRKEKDKIGTAQRRLDENGSQSYAIINKNPS